MLVLILLLLLVDEQRLHGLVMGVMVVQVIIVLQDQLLTHVQYVPVLLAFEVEPFLIMERSLPTNPPLSRVLQRVRAKHERVTSITPTCNAKFF